MGSSSSVYSLERRFITLSLPSIVAGTCTGVFVE